MTNLEKMVSDPAKQAKEETPGMAFESMVFQHALDLIKTLDSQLDEISQEIAIQFRRLRFECSPKVTHSKQALRLDQRMVFIAYRSNGVFRSQIPFLLEVQ